MEILADTIRIIASVNIEYIIMDRWKLKAQMESTRAQVVGNNRTYASIANDDYSFQFRITVIINIISTPISFLTAYLVLTKSKKELQIFKYVLFITHFSFYISCVHLGSFLGVVLLYPFPGVYANGLLRDRFSALELIAAWTFFFELFIYGSLLLMIIRLKIVARKGKLFDFKTSTYFLMSFFLAVYVFLAPSISIFLTRATEDEIRKFVEAYYPLNTKVLQKRGLMVVVDSKVQLFFLISTAIQMIIGIFIVVSVGTMISYEMREQTKSISNHHLYEHKRSLNVLVLQNIIIAVAVLISCVMLLKSVLHEPELDSRVSQAIAFGCLMGVSIPSQLMTIFRTTAYRSFVLSFLIRRHKRTTITHPIHPSIRVDVAT